MGTNSIVSLASIQLPSPARILPSSWCPDKDLLVVITRLGTKDRMSLWKMQGSKKWEIGFDFDDASSQHEVVSISWSPDGQALAVAHNPPHVTLHSIQNGHQERSLPISPPLQGLGTRRTVALTGIWWFAPEQRDTKNSIPDIFKRDNIITGSAHSILKGQPLLDSLQDESQPLTAADLFAFHGTHTRAPTSSLPEMISAWPTLPQDLLVASIQPSKLGGGPHPGEDLDEVDTANVDSVLVVTDDSGHMYGFLDGSYPLGVVDPGLEFSTISLLKEKDLLLAQPRFSHSGQMVAGLLPITLRLPQLQQRTLREVARTSSSVRELVWYTMRVVKDMRAAWFGSDTQNGARELGPKWVHALEERQRVEFGYDEPHAMLDLTCLLATGRTSESLSDYLGSGEQMSERGLQKWESTMVDALIKLRDYAEKRVAPACQRMQVLLEEVLGWSRLSQYDACDFNASHIHTCLELTGRAIVLSGWLAATARRELARFKEFMTWLKHETSHASSSSDHNHPAPKHDILEVNDYLMSGLVVSAIDKWFMGPVPSFSPHDLGVPKDWQDLHAVMHRARAILNEPKQLEWGLNVKQKDLSHLDRNLDSLIQDLATRCQRIFLHAASAAARSAIVVSSPSRAGIDGAISLHGSSSHSGTLMRERTVKETTKPGKFQQYLLMQAAGINDRSYLCISRMRDGHPSVPALHVDIAVLACLLPKQDEREEEILFDVLDADFFDDSSLVLVYRIDQSAFLATIGYSDITYHTIEVKQDVNDFTREALMATVVQELQENKLLPIGPPILKSRRLTGCREGSASLAVNGRVGRRVACVLDDTGLALEILDIEGEDDESEMSAVAA